MVDVFSSEYFMLVIRYAFALFTYSKTLEKREYPGITSYLPQLRGV